MRNPFAAIRDMWCFGQWVMTKKKPCRSCGKEFYPERLFDGFCADCVIKVWCGVKL